MTASNLDKSFNDLARNILSCKPISAMRSSKAFKVEVFFESEQ